MKEIYLDIMEKSLSAYDEQRIRDYIADVRDGGLTEHGFPRLGADIGILIAHGRRTELTDTFLEIMDLCCDQMPEKKAANDFSVREICCCLMLLEETLTEKNGRIAARIPYWKSRMASFRPWERYNVIAKSPDTVCGNWAAFAAVSEFVRGKYCGVDTTEFVDWQISSQLLAFDECGMYKDPANPMVYDLVPRLLLSFLLLAGYDGKLAGRIEELLERSDELTLHMQSVTGEIPFGGRSNQFLHNEPMLSSFCEMAAIRYARKGDLEKAGKFRAAALLAARYTLDMLNAPEIHHVKNRYDSDSGIGCEGYGYFNKYMITTASNIYPAYLFADDSIVPTVAPAEQGGYAAQTGTEFHKTFLNAGGYFLEFDTDADFHYDANGLGRIHKKGCPSMLCLTVPFSPAPNYGIDGTNPGPMSLCCFAGDGEHRLIGAERYARHRLISHRSTEEEVRAVFECRLSDSVLVTETYTVSGEGVTVLLDGPDDVGFLLPVFDFDGQEHSEISVGDTAISVRYGGAVCTFRFDHAPQTEPAFYWNRNGRYRVYAVPGKRLHIEMTRGI